MKKIIVVFNLLVFHVSFLSGQLSFEVGVGQRSIEPDKSLISLALSGYAAPGEGRFTLQWIKMESLPEITAITGISEKLFLISNSELLSKNITEGNSVWRRIGRAQDLVAIACVDDILYAINNNGELLKSKANKIKWERISFVDKSFTILTSLGNKLIAANDKGEIWSARILNREPGWSLISTLNGIISLAAIKDDLYALTGNGIIYKSDHKGDSMNWLKIAYKNDITIKEDIRHIAIADNGIYGISYDNNLYEGEHRTEGNLSARAMTIKSSDNTVVILNIDLVGLSDQYVGMLKEEIFKKHKIHPSAILRETSHSTLIQ